MIKIKLFILAIILPCLLYSQESTVFPIDPDTKLVSYQGVVQMNGTQDELYVRGIDWLNKYYKNPFDVSRVRNRESGVIEVMHRIELTNDVDGVNLQAGTVNYELRIEFKPGRYRYTLTNLTWRQASRFPIERWLNKEEQSYSPLWETYIQQVDLKAKEIIENLKNGMQPVEVKPEEKW